MSLTGGTTTYSGSLSGTTWTLTSSGTVPNPSGPHAAAVVRTVSMQAQITTTTQADMRPWDYLFVDQPAGCITMGNSVTMDVSLYVRGNLCLTNNSQISSPAVHLLGNLSVENSAQIGSVGSPIGEFARTGTCSYGGSVTSRGPPSHVYADAVGTSPPVIAKPTVRPRLLVHERAARPAVGLLDGLVPRRIRQRLDAQREPRRDRPHARIGVRLPEARRSENVVAQIAWTPGSPGTLTIKGVIYFDAHLSWSNLNLIQYDGKAVIYGSGQVRIKNRADICGVPACDSTWDPRVDLLVFVAGSLVSQSSTDPIGGDIGNHVNFQGALYIVNDFDMDNNTTVWGPVITRSTTINNSALINAPPLPIQWMYGMPGATQTVTEVNPVQGSYAG